jgi:hypothetical protein
MKILEKNSKAFKEWAIVVDALGKGRQILIFRKGGIHEGIGGFEVEEREFFLFPTYEHQNKEELIPEIHPRLEEIITQQPKDGQVHLNFYASIQAVYKITDIERLYKLEGHHIWTRSLIEERFNWGKEKGLYVFALRVFRLPKEIVTPYQQEYGGCKSWLSFQQSYSTEGTPILSNPAFHEKLRAVQRILQ